jgi:nucleoid-associated protein YgaU
MKQIFLLFFALTFAASGFLYAQKPDVELTKDEALVRIQEFQNKIKDLENSLKDADKATEATRKDLVAAKKSLKDCQESLYSLIGATPADVDKFRQNLGVIEGKQREMSRLSDDVLAEKGADIKALEDDLAVLQGNKISLLPEFFDRIVKLAKDLRGLYREKKIKTYTVGTWAENKDCLWNIAGKIEIYGDPFQWPKIWQGNTDIVRNPDIIHPGQVLLIPLAGPMTPDEIKAERKYWRIKRAAMDKKAAEEGTQAKPGPEIPKETGKKGN